MPVLNHDNDLRYKLFQEQSRSKFKEPLVFAIAVTISRVASSGTLAVIIRTSDTPFVTSRQYLGEGTLVGLGSALVSVVIISAAKYVRGEYANLQQMLNVALSLFTDVSGFIAFAGSACVAWQ